ncbi:MAG: DNA/RNA nuclease SfsA [Kosmotogaceae bacterium]
MKTFRWINYPKEASFISRHNRFTAIVKDKSFEKLVYLPDPGRLEELLIPNANVIIEKRRETGKTYHDLLLVETVSFLDKRLLMVSVDSRLPNILFRWLIEEELINHFGKIKQIKSEPKVDNGRLDYYIESTTGKHYIELKSVNLIDASGTARFPDAPTKRGTKHLNELMNLKNQGYNCWIFFIVVRSDAITFSPFFERDPLFSKTLKKAQKAGINIRALKFEVDSEIKFLKEIPVNLNQNPFAGYWPE